MSKGRKHISPKKSSNQQKAQHINNQGDIPENIGYPDLSKINTKIVVIASFICVLLILLLSILFPAQETDKEPTTEATTENEIISGRDPATGFSVIDNKTYYYPDNENRFSGWYEINDAIYYFDEDGVMVTGWCALEGHQYYFNTDGIMASNQWIENRYVGEDGYLLKDTITPDGGYVDINGIRDDTVSLETSREGLTDLQDELQSMLDGYTGSWSVYVKDINSNEYMVINNMQFFSASLIKLFCAACAYDLIDKGTLEDTENIDRLMQEMISVSDNDAFNLMVMNCAPDHYHVTGRGVIQEYIDTNHYSDTTITSILVPTRYKAPSSAGRNYTSVIDCGLLLERIYKGQCVSPEASQKFLDLLLQQSHVNKIPAGLPEGTRCANKTGDTDEVQHDVAIVYSPKGVYILCIMSTGCGSSISNIQSLSKTVYEYFNPDTQLEIYEFSSSDDTEEISESSEQSP
ncbi:MAG: serine hydrolase [Lachnospiraceae bacterium]|nr:serine hydrolase [Lachnospiraceae bacterium]